MPSKIFVNLPVANLPVSVEFFTALGYRFNKQFTDETAACLVITGDIYFMLLTHQTFKRFSDLEINDPRKRAAALYGLSVDSREAVDEMVRKAIAAGGKPYREPVDHGGFMYQHGFEDPDGHIWEIFHMDPAAIQPQ